MALEYLNIKNHVIPQQSIERCKFTTPEFQIKELCDNVIIFDLKNVDASTANALRRIMIAEIPTMTIDLVEFDENTTVLSDEVLAHRLALIPLISKEFASFVYPDECICKDRQCSKCSVTFKLEVEGSDKINNVTSDDFYVVGNSNVKPVNYKNEQNSDAPILIVRLKPKQQLKLTAIVRKGTGKDHSKWSPVVTATYKKFNVDSEISPVVGGDNIFRFYVETTGAISPNNLLLLSLQILNTKLTEIRNSPKHI